MFGPGEDGYGRNRRIYFGHCLHCDTSAEVQQFERMGQWLIHRHKIDDYEEWVEMNLLPDLPVIQTGPGGDYAQQISDAELEATLIQTQRTADQLARVLIELVDIIKGRKQRHADKHG